MIHFQLHSLPFKVYVGTLFEDKKKKRRLGGERKEELKFCIALVDILMLNSNDYK